MYDIFVEGKVVLVVPAVEHEGGNPVYVTVDLNGLHIKPESGSEKVFTWPEVFRKFL